MVLEQKIEYYHAIKHANVDILKQRERGYSAKSITVDSYGGLYVLYEKVEVMGYRGA